MDMNKCFMMKYIRKIDIFWPKRVGLKSCKNRENLEGVFVPFL
jgi:hypothetical protein